MASVVNQGRGGAPVGLTGVGMSALDQTTTPVVPRKVSSIQALYGGKLADQFFTFNAKASA